MIARWIATAVLTSVFVFGYTITCTTLASEPTPSVRSPIAPLPRALAADDDTRRPLPGIRRPSIAPIRTPLAFLAPTNLRITAVTPGGFNLGWQDNSPAAAGFYVEVKEADGPFVDQKISVPRNQPNGPSYSLSSLKPNQRYAFRVRAWRFSRTEPTSEIQTSGYSNEVVATAASTLVHDFKVVVHSRDELELTWACDCVGVGSLLLESRHDQDPFSQGPFVDMQGTAKRLLLPFAATLGTTLSYRFVSRRSGAWQLLSNEARVTLGMPELDGPPAAPTFLSAMRTNAAQGNLDWAVRVDFKNVHSMVLERRTSDSPGFAPIARMSVVNRDRYSGVVTLSRDSGDPTYELLTPHPENGVIRYADRTLRPGTDYVYRVRSINSLGESASLEVPLR